MTIPSWIWIVVALVVAVLAYRWLTTPRADGQIPLGAYWPGMRR